MKLKSIVFALFTAVATFTTQAQIGGYRNDMCLGVSVGASMNKMGFDPIITQKFHTAPTVGLTFRYTSEKFLSAYCALQVELNYTRLGWTEDVLDSNSNPLPDTFKSNLDYLQSILKFQKLGYAGYVNTSMMFLRFGSSSTPDIIE